MVGDYKPMIFLQLKFYNRRPVVILRKGTIEIITPLQAILIFLETSGNVFLHKTIVDEQTYSDCN